MTTYNATSKSAQNIVRSGGLGYSHSGLVASDGIQLTSPDYSLLEGFSGAPSSVYKSTQYVTWNFDDNGSAVLSANYAPEGVQSDRSCWSELELELPVNAVQVLVKFREFIPASYTSDQAGNHKSVEFYSGTYSKVLANISVSSECWPKNGNGYPSIYVGNDGQNYGHFRLPEAEELPLWVEGDGNWHDITALMELSPTQGGYGRYRIWRDGVVIADSDDDRWFLDYDNSIRARDTLHYSDRGNYIDRVRIFGWANRRVDLSVPAFAGTMHFLYDDLEIHANTSFKAVIGA